MNQRTKTSFKIDVQLVVYYIILVTLGWFTIYSSSKNQFVDESFFSFSNLYTKQLIFIGTSILLAMIILLIDSRLWIHYSNHIYIASLLLMILVFFVGTEINGALAWIKIGNFSIQPTE
ncbi:MAG: FtsW/RodA/SpoVE family cell cycle protein, partial [Bacteroidales bacterium]|nr:FtsW/RodA/SpoVE family cell cycle protein [Bacteroidales bacterium]